jgi:hypothetical protein
LSLRAFLVVAPLLDCGGQLYLSCDARGQARPILPLHKE